MLGKQAKMCPQDWCLLLDALLRLGLLPKKHLPSTHNMPDHGNSGQAKGLFCIKGIEDMAPEHQARFPIRPRCRKDAAAETVGVQSLVH